MSQIYSDPSRANEPGALPDVEVFYVAEGTYPVEGGYLPAGWYGQSIGTNYNADGSCHPDCGPIVLDACDVRGKAPLLNTDGEHAHEDEQDGRCWHPTWCEPNGPFATRAEAIADAQGERS